MSKLTISMKNSKLGNIPNLSLPPWTTCDPDAPCREKCYARKAYAHYARKTVQPAWDGNLTFYEEDPKGFFDMVRLRCEALVAEGYRYFRWHVGGDVPDYAYAIGMQWVAFQVPKMQFLVYTRKTRFFLEEDIKALPNLTILKSVWLGEPLDPLRPCFQVVPKGTLEKDNPRRCPGKCDHCYACWNMTSGEYKQIELH